MMRFLNVKLRSSLDLIYIYIYIYILIYIYIFIHTRINTDKDMSIHCEYKFIFLYLFHIHFMCVDMLTYHISLLWSYQYYEHIFRLLSYYMWRDSCSRMNAEIVTRGEERGRWFFLFYCYAVFNVKMCSHT